jgi:hypothetical protein
MMDVLYSLLTLEAFTPRGMLQMSLAMLQQSAEVLQYFMSEPESRVVWQEFSNKTPHSLYKDPKSLISWGCSESWVEMYFQTMT